MDRALIWIISHGNLPDYVHYNGSNQYIAKVIKISYEMYI